MEFEHCLGEIENVLVLRPDGPVADGLDEFVQGEGHYHPDHQYNIIDYPNEQQRDSEEEEYIEEDGLEILRNSDTLIACSDGSYDPLEQKAAFNWRIVTADEKGLTLGSAPVNTNPKYLNTYRAEFAGLRGAIRYMKKH
eukprot:scaffold32310_cov26-Cyclotella_meneghiniana.AAC.1